MKRFYERFKNLINLGIIIMILLLVSVHFYFNNLAEILNRYEVDYNDKLYSENEYEDNNYYHLIEGQQVFQTFFSNINEMSGIVLRFKNYENQKVRIRVIDNASGEELCNKYINIDINKSIKGIVMNSDALSANKVTSGSNSTKISLDSSRLIKQGIVIISFDKKQESTKNKEFTVEINPEQINKECPASVLMFEKTNKDSHMIINNIEQNSTIQVAIVKGNTTFLKYYLGLIAIIIFFLVILAYILLYIKKYSLEKAYIPIVFTAGLLYMLMTVPLTVPDEASHYATAYMYSNKILHVQSLEIGYIYMRKDDADQLNNMNSPLPSIDLYKDIYNNFFTKAQDKELVKTAVCTPKTNGFQYWIAALGIAVARVIGLGSISTIYLGRMFNFLLFMGLTYLAIKRIPFGKIVLFVTVLMPYTMQQACSYSYDVIAISLTFYLISLFLDFYCSKKDMSFKELIKLLIISCLLAPIKGGAYLPVCFLAIILPKRLFKNKKKYVYTKIVFLFVPILSFFVFNLSLITDNLNSDIWWSDGSAYSISYLIKSPIVCFRIIFNTLFSNATSDSITFIFNGYLGSSLIRICDKVVFVFYTMLIISGVKEKEQKYILHKKDKICIVLVLILSIIIIEFEMLIHCTPNDYYYVIGMQGRYFIPLLPLAVLLINNDNLVLKKTPKNLFVMISILLYTVVIYNWFSFFI